MSHDSYTLHRGSTPVLISLPHVGTLIPQEIGADLVEPARPLAELLAEGIVVEEGLLLQLNVAVGEQIGRAHV